jgi:hypothetical protein
MVKENEMVTGIYEYDVPVEKQTEYDRPGR